MTPRIEKRVAKSTGKEDKRHTSSVANANKARDALCAYIEYGKTISLNDDSEDEVEIKKPKEETPEEEEDNEEDNEEEE